MSCRHVSCPAFSVLLALNFCLFFRFILALRGRRSSGRGCLAAGRGMDPRARGRAFQRHAVTFFILSVTYLIKLMKQGKIVQGLKTERNCPTLKHAFWSPCAGSPTFRLACHITRHATQKLVSAASCYLNMTLSAGHPSGGGFRHNLA